MDDRSRSWILRDAAIQAALVDESRSHIKIGGRFVCESDDEEEVMIASLADAGLDLCDMDQCEIVGTKEIALTKSEIYQAIDDFRALADRLDLRLQAVETGEIESGMGTVLASEVGCIPWWSIKGNGS